MPYPSRPYPEPDDYDNREAYEEAIDRWETEAYYGSLNHEPMDYPTDYGVCG